MVEKSFAIATWAAGASIAAVSLAYVFLPTKFSGSNDNLVSLQERRKGVVGLHNRANDCFINAVLQALAGLPDLRSYLVHELHRRSQYLQDGLRQHSLQTASEYPVDDNEPTGSPTIPHWMRLDQERGTITAALKEVLDSLHTSAGRRTTSASTFIVALESAFRIGLRRTQQDAQEFLQIVTERLSDEFHAGEGVRLRLARETKTSAEFTPCSTFEASSADQGQIAPMQIPIGLDDGLPFEGKTESSLTCAHCRFSPTPSASTFTTLTLHVPQQISTTTLTACFDAAFLVEHIDDYRCDRCYLNYALHMKQHKLSSAGSRSQSILHTEIAAIEKALVTDPEDLPHDADLPDFRHAPKRRISRSSRISVFPKLLAIHLSRSMWTNTSASTKNQAKVSFEEALSLGGLAQRVRYRLLAVITHQGAHNSGHYVSFRRQHVRSQTTDTCLSDQVQIISQDEGNCSTSAIMPSSIDASARNGDDSTPPTNRRGSPRPTHQTERSSQSGIKAGTTGSDGMSRLEGKQATKIHQRSTKKQHDRWWRISDDKVRECTTKDVLAMQREVYLLFYERIMV